MYYNKTAVQSAKIFKAGEKNENSEPQNTDFRNISKMSEKAI